MAGMEEQGSAYDWVDDEQLSPEETLRRFAALSPGPVEAPDSTEPESDDSSHGVLVANAAGFHITGNSAAPSGPVTVGGFGLVRTG